MNLGLAVAGVHNTKVEAKEDLDLKNYQIKSIATPMSKMGSHQPFAPSAFPKSLTPTGALFASTMRRSLVPSVITKTQEPHQLLPLIPASKGAEIVRQWLGENVTTRFFEKRKSIMETKHYLEEKKILIIPTESVASRRNLLPDLFGLKEETVSLEKVLEAIPLMMQPKDVKAPENSMMDEEIESAALQPPEPELGLIGQIHPDIDDSKSQIGSKFGADSVNLKIFSESEMNELFLTLLTSLHKCDHVLAARITEILQSRCFLQENEILFPSKKSSLIYFPSQNQPLQKYYNSYGRTVCLRAPKLLASPQHDILLTDVGAENFSSIGLSDYHHQAARGVLSYLLNLTTSFRSLGWALARFLWLNSSREERKLIWQICQMKALSELTDKTNLFCTMRFLATVSMTLLNEDATKTEDSIISIPIMESFVQISTGFIGIEEKLIGRHPPEWRFGTDGEYLLEFTASIITLIWRWSAALNTEEYRPLFSATLLQVFNMLSFSNIARMYEPFWVQHILQNGEILDLILKSNPLQLQAFLKVVRGDRLVGRSLVAKGVFCKSLKECMVEQGLYKHVLPLFESNVYQQDNVALFAHLVKDFMRVNPSHHLDTQKKLKEALQAQKDFSCTVEERRLQHLYCVPFMRSVEFETNSLFGCFEDIIKIEKEHYKEFRAVKTDIEKVSYLMPVIGEPCGKLIAVKSMVGQSRLAEKFPNIPRLSSKLPTQALLEVDLSFDTFASATPLEITHPDSLTHSSKAGKLIKVGKALYHITLVQARLNRSKINRLVVKKLSPKNQSGTVVMDYGCLFDDESFEVWQPSKETIVIGITEKETGKVKMFGVYSVPRFIRIFEYKSATPQIYQGFYKTESGIIGIWLPKPVKSSPYIAEDAFSLLITKYRKFVSDIPTTPQIYSIAASGPHISYAGPYGVTLLRLQATSVYAKAEYKLMKGMPYAKLFFVSPNIIACNPLFEGEIAATLIKINKSRVVYLNYPHNKPVDFNLDKFPPKNLLDQFLSSERTCLYMGFDQLKKSLIQVFYSEEKTNPQSLAGVYSSHPPKKFQNMTQEEILETVLPTVMPKVEPQTLAAVLEPPKATPSTSKQQTKPKTRSNKASSSSQRKGAAVAEPKKTAPEPVTSISKGELEEPEPKEKPHDKERGPTVKIVVRSFASPLVTQWIWDQY